MTERYMTLSEMAKIQHTLNEYTVSEWRRNLNVNDFRTAMFDEFAELLNSASWKWWKKSDIAPDTWNLKIEAIDILHFALSSYILNNTISVYPNLILGQFNTDNAYMINNNHIDRNVFINKACAVLTSDDPNALDSLLNSLGLLAEEVSAIYTAKSELNFIRQDEGYKNGDYVKVQDGLEDNVRLEKVVEGFLNSDDSLTQLRKNVREAFYEQAKEVQEENHY